MEYETKQEDGWWAKLRESPRTVSALIIILVVAAAIYAFSGDNKNEEIELAESAEPTEAAEQVEGEATSETTDAATQTMTPAPVAQETLMEAVKDLPKATQTSEGYTEVAEAGNGLTHLTRRAATRWLAENDPGYTVTNEHRVFIEDYLQKQLGAGRMEIGQEVAISFGLMEEAVKAAGELTPQQLNNLSKYTSALS